MSFSKKTVAVAVVGFLLSTPVAFAQAGGGDVPSDAKKQGEKEIPGSTGKADKGADSGSMMKKDGGSMEKKSGDKM